MKSIVQERGNVAFPEHTGQRIYMREFRKADGLPFDLARWQPTVDAMLDGVDTDGPLYLMVDQGMVCAGTPHRRPGVHVDGYWVPATYAHGGGGTHSSGVPASPPGSHGGGSHSYTPRRHDPGSHSGGGRHMAGGWDTGGGWVGATYEAPEGILLASSVQACRAFAGEFNGTPGDGGDCSHIDISSMEEIIMRPGAVYAGNVTMLHESLAVPFDCLRTVVRLNVPGWTPDFNGFN